MKRLTVAAMVGVVVALATASAATAFEGGGRKPSEAPLIAWGQHYTGKLNNRKSDANYGGYREVALWRLPPVNTHDLVTVNWHELPFAHDSSFPICMILVQGINDYNWGSVFGEEPLYECSESGPVYSVAGSGTASTPITIQNPDTSSTYLEFFAYSGEEEAADFETFPYDFTVEAPRQFLGLAVTPKKKVHANGAIEAAATLANGLPVPDGVVFNLTVEWEGNGITTYTAASVGGHLTFVLALPEIAWRKRGTFIVSRGPDSLFQGVREKTHIRIAPPVASAAELACRKARGHAHALRRQLKRLQRRAASARGSRKRHLRHRAHGIGRKFRRARRHAGAVCGA